MSRYYDHKSISCDGCAYLQKDAFPNGEQYEACRYYGYILHPAKGISSEPCEKRNATTHIRAKSLRQLK